jgi:Tfp pilus assembly protein PilF/TolB-like protein
MRCRSSRSYSRWNRVFSSRARGALVLALFTTLILSNCQQKPAGTRRLAILRFENLTGDDSLNWMGRAVSEIMDAELAGSRAVSVIDFRQLHASDHTLGPRPIAAPGISTERTAALLLGANRILYGHLSRVGTNLRLAAELFDGSRGKIERVLSATGPESDGVIRLADSLAKQLAAPARTFGTPRDQALRAYCMGLESSDPHAALAEFSRAVAADPNFGQAYVAWAQLAAGLNDRTEAERVLALVSARGSAIQELERARIAALAAELRGDQAGTRRALEIVAQLDPGDVGLFRRLAQAHLNARRYNEAAQSIKNALEVEPENPELWNDLGYAEMFAGDLTAAVMALDEYRRIRPGDPNALDSLGDVNFYFGQFAEAEKYYRQAFEMDNTFNGGSALMKAAHARLRTGDISRADALFNQYLEARRKDNDLLTELRRAEWEFVTGRRKQAVERLEAFARSLPPELAPGLAPQVYAQLAVWELELSDRTRAREFAQRAQGPRGSAMAAVARFLCQAPAPPAAWRQRAVELLPRPEDERTRNLMLGYALLLQNEFSAAVPVLSDAYQHSAAEPREILPVLVAWAQIETGHIDDAARFVQRNPISNPTPDLFASLAFPRLLRLRAAVLEKQGKAAEAAATRRLFVTLSGQDVHNP